MRKFSSYGPVNTAKHYFAPRQELINKAYVQLVGEEHDEGGHYITTWAPRQTGKTWVMQETVQKIKKENQYEVGILSIESAKKEKDEKEVVKILTQKMAQVFQKQFPTLGKIREIPILFTKQYFQEPVIMIIDEFDSLEEDFINGFASIFRDMYIARTNERDKKSKDKTNLLHGLALVGVRSVLGIENVKGSPFNVQRSLHIPELTYDEVDHMFKWYQKESGRTVEQNVIDALYREIQGQPGLTCWFGELLTEGFEDHHVDTGKPMTLRDFEIAYAAATYALPNNNILNIISKAKQEPYKEFIFQMFQTDEKIEFRFDNRNINALYMNGVVDKEVVDHTKYYVKFSSPFVQKRLFNYFSDELFNYMGKLTEPFVNLDNVITETHLNIPNLMRLYQEYLKKNREWLFKSVPRRTDMRIYEAVFHFNLYSYLNQFLKTPGGKVLPEFPTGNGKIDLIVMYGNYTYGIELKSYTNERNYKEALEQAAKYGKQLNLPEIFIVFFIEYIDQQNREKYEKDYHAKEARVTVKPIIIETGT